jgi:hypothetical protein
MIHQAGYKRGDTPPEYDMLDADRTAYDRAYEVLKAEAEDLARLYVAGKNKVVFEALLDNGDLRCGDAGTMAFAIALAGSDAAVKNILLQEICHLRAVRLAEGD